MCGGDIALDAAGEARNSDGSSMLGRRVMSVAVPHRAPAERDPLRGRDIICFSNDWHGDPLCKKHLMRLLARDNRILWVNSIGYRVPNLSRRDLTRALEKLRAFATPVREVEPNIFVLNPLALPSYGPAGRWITRLLLKNQVRRAMRRLQFQEPINWIFNPAAGVVAGSLDESLLIYHCVDEHTAFHGAPVAAVTQLERALLRQADLVITSSAALFDAKSRLRPKDTVLVRHGVDHSHFRSALDPSTSVAEELRGLPRPVIGYFGLLAEEWVDVPLIAAVARRFSHCTVALVGKVTADLSALKGLSNVRLFGRQPYARLPNFCRGFDVALIPFPISELTQKANPLKCREYLAAGVPVVSTAIPEVELLSQCRIGRTTEEFLLQIARTLQSPRSSHVLSESVRTETWSARLDEIRGHLSQAIDTPRSAWSSQEHHQDGRSRQAG